MLRQGTGSELQSPEVELCDLAISSDVCCLCACVCLCARMRTCTCVVVCAFEHCVTVDMKKVGAEPVSSSWASSLTAFI